MNRHMTVTNMSATDEEPQGPVATVKSVLDKVIAARHTVESNGNDPTVLSMLNNFEHCLFNMMRGAKHHGTKAVQTEILTEATLFAENLNEKYQLSY